jgi:hypothetical protein
MNQTNSQLNPAKASGPGLAVMAGLLFTVLSVLMYRSYVPRFVQFSNDGPLGRMISACHKLPERFTGSWSDLNLLGSREGPAPPNLSFALQYLLKPVLFSKFYALISLLLLGLGAWCFFRQLGLAPIACALGGLAAALNSNYFSVACWGISSHVIALAMIFFALALLAKESRTTLPRLMLAGLAVGMAVSEGADTGAILSVYVAAYVIYQALVQSGRRVTNSASSDQPRIAAPAALATDIAGAAARLALVALCAFWVAAQAVVGLVATNIEGIAGTQQDALTRAEHWDWATQWSLPKREAVGFVAPGIFGYRMDSQNGGNYWGATGRDPAWDRYFASGAQGTPPTGFKRYSGGGFYAGMVVVLVALWTGIVALRKESPLSPIQRRWIWFWMGVTVLSLLLAFGRYAPFYRLVYSLPYLSTIRNPVKFIYLVSFGLIVVFAYGVDALWRKYLFAQVAANRLSKEGDRRQKADARAHAIPRWGGLMAWWKNAGSFDKAWAYGCIGALAAMLSGWIIYASLRPALESYLVAVRFDEAVAPAIAAFSLRQVGWFVLFFVLGATLMILILSGAFSGSRARWAGLLLGALLVVDLGRANQPWLIYWDYKEKYASNPVLDTLREKPYEHRVAVLPFRPPQNLKLLDQVFRLEWLQHQLPYYDVQSLDVVQMPRLPEDLAAFEGALLPTNQTSISRLDRYWQLTNTRYLLGAAAFLDSLNEKLDPVQRRFRIAERFNLALKPGASGSASLSDLTAIPNARGSFALFEFTGALPRARLYSHWQVCTNDSEALSQLTGQSFDPEGNVLVAESLPPSPGGEGPALQSTSEQGASVEFASYAPKDIVFKSHSPAPTVLLLNDRFDPNWKVLVDGRTGTLLRCNYLMRGVYLQAGAHTIEFRFQPSVGALYVSLAAIVFGLSLLGFVLLEGRRSSPAASVLWEPQPVLSRPRARAAAN